jgi:hypothetical protein
MALSAEPTYAVRAAPAGLVMPGLCACCGAVAARALVERRARDRATAWVPYCTVCHRHASAVRTRRLAGVLSSSVLALTTAASLPLLWPFVPAVLYGCLVLAAASLPALALPVWWRRRPRAGHTAVGRAAWWLEPGELCCTSSRFASELALGNAASVRNVSALEPRWVGWMAAGWVLALAVSPFLFWLHRPLVRIVNLTDTRLIVRVDGHPLGLVEPTSTENARAGVEVRVPSGQREFLAEGPGGQVVARAAVHIHGAKEHLYAPGSKDYCFWLETTGYGRAAPPNPRIEPLAGEVRFWVLPGHVDTWFDKNPEAAPGDRRTSGGSLTALRQALCADAPGTAER